MSFLGAFPAASILLLLLLSYASVAPGESVNDEDAADSSVQKPVIASFSVDSALVLVGAEVELRCRVSRVNGGMFVRLSKWVLGTTNYEVLTTNMVKEQSIRDIERYSISAEQYGDHGGYDFIFTISDARVEDSGTYACNVPALDETKRVTFSVVAEPKSLQLYVDGRLIVQDSNSTTAAEIEYKNVTRINVTCLVAGGHPEPVLSFIIDPSANVAEKSVSAVCREKELGQRPFLPNITCSGTAVIQQYIVDYSTSGKSVGCTARSRGSTDARLSASFVPRLAGAPPVLKCPWSVLAAVYERSVKLVCHVLSGSPVTDAGISWDGRQRLRPTTRSDWPPGVKFDRDDEYMAYLRQGGNETVLELEFGRVFPQMFRDYTFVSSNHVGTSRHTIALVRDAAKEALRSTGFRDVSTHFVYVISLAVTSLYWRR